MQSIYADSRTSIAILPFLQVPGSSVVARAQGLAPDVTATICVRNVTTTYKFQGTVKVIEVDQIGNSASHQVDNRIVVLASPFY